MLYTGGDFNVVWSNILVGSATVGHGDVMRYAWAMVDGFLKDAVIVDSFESILEVQADEGKVREIQLFPYQAVRPWTRR